MKKLADVDIVFHLAYLNGTNFFMSEMVPDIAVRVLHIIKSSINNNVSDFYLASSSEVYQTPDFIPTSEKFLIPDILNPRYSYGGILRNLWQIRKIFKDIDDHTMFITNRLEHVIPNFITKIDEGIKVNSEMLI